MASKRPPPDLRPEDQVLEVQINVQTRGKSVAVYTMDHDGLPVAGKIELMDRQVRLVKRLLLELTSGKSPDL